MSIERIFVPFGEWRPDRGRLANSDLRMARGVVPLHGDYISQPANNGIKTLTHNGTAYGMEISSFNNAAYILVSDGGGNSLVEVSNAAVETERSRTGAGNYLSTAQFMDGATFGSNVIVTIAQVTTPANNEPVQYLASGAARFANMITSAFEPRAKFAFVFRGNLFLANCYNPTAFDGLAATTAYPRLVAWSQTDNIRQFGSFNVTPQFTGAGYQELNFDIGDIVDAVAATDYAMIGMEGGLVRVDGPPYQFRVVARGHGLAAPNMMTVVGDDIYYLSRRGVMRLRGGDGQPETVGEGKFARWLVDAVNAFAGDQSLGPIGTVTNGSALRYNSLNDLLLMTYTGGDFASTISLWYNIGEDRGSFSKISYTNAFAFLRNAVSDGSYANWAPGLDLKFLESISLPGSLANQSLQGFTNGAAPVDIDLRCGLKQPNPNSVTRVRRVRPIYYSRGQDLHNFLTAQVITYNDPNGTPGTSSTYSTYDSHGWIPIPDSKFGDFHEVYFKVASGHLSYYISEYEGFEAELETPDTAYSQ